MEFVLNNKRYSIVDHELFINYLIVDSYFRSNRSKYEYDISFEFINPILDKENVEFKDILEGTKVLEELIEKEQIGFIPAGLKIEEIDENHFRIIYQDIAFDGVNVGEAIPLLIALNSLVTYRPIVTLVQIEEELNYFLEKFRSYSR